VRNRYGRGRRENLCTMGERSVLRRQKLRLEAQNSAHDRGGTSSLRKTVGKRKKKKTFAKLEIFVNPRSKGWCGRTWRRISPVEGHKKKKEPSKQKKDYANPRSEVIGGKKTQARSGGSR